MILKNKYQQAEEYIQMTPDMEQRILESINFMGSFQNGRALLALMPSGPPFPSIIIRTGIGYLAGRPGTLLE